LLVDQRDVSTVAADYRPRNGETEGNASGFAVPRILHPEERRENLLPGAVGNTGSIIRDDDLDAIRSLLNTDSRALSIADRILNKVTARATKRIGPAEIADLLSLGEGHIVAKLDKIVAEALDEGANVDRSGALGSCLFAGERKGRLSHGLNLMNCREHLLPDVLVGHEFRAQ